MSAQDCEAQDGGWGLLGELPGDPMIWVLIFSELAVFGALLCAFAIARGINPTEFASGQALLNPGLAGLNTVVLVTSGWAAARGAAAARARQACTCRRWLVLTIGLGWAFVAVKFVEYAGEIATGAGLETSTFFTLYFLLTGFHLLHVVLGMVILAVVWRGAEVEIQFWLFFAAAGAAVVGYLFHFHEGREFLEQPFPIKVGIVVVCLMFLFNVTMTALKGRKTTVTNILLFGLWGVAICFLFAFYNPANLAVDKMYWWSKASGS